MTEIIPAIDIIGGRCVRLTQGDYGKQTTYGQTPVEMVRLYADAGVKRIHLVDLDGARAGEPRNLDVLREVSAATDLTIEWGGGIKTTRHLHDVLDAGADCAIIGSVAVRDPQLMEEWLRELGGDVIALGGDVRRGKVAVSGWLEESDLTVSDLVDRFLPFGLKQVIVTDISRDGMLQGPGFDIYTDLAARYPDVIFTVSGGISSDRDILKVDRLGLPRVIVGKAIYEGRISLSRIKELITMNK